MSSHKSLRAVVTDFAFTLMGILVFTFAIKSFLVPNGFLDGGITGMSLLVHELWHLPLSLVIIVVNIPFVIMGGYQINRKFAFKTFISIVILGLSLQFLPMPDITESWQDHNLVLIAIFAGFFLGIGIGLGMRGGCALDGIEILAIYTRKRIGLTTSEIILAINALIFLVAAIELGLETAFYAMLTYFVATRTIDYVVEGIEEYTGITIISAKSEQIKEKLAKEMGRGITIYKGERGFMKDSYEVSHDVDIVFTIATRLEVRKIKMIISTIDPKAFVFTGSIKEATGGLLKNASGHHH